MNPKCEDRMPFGICTVHALANSNEFATVKQFKSTRGIIAAKKTEKYWCKMQIDINSWKSWSPHAPENTAFELYAKFDHPKQNFHGARRPEITS